MIAFLSRILPCQLMLSISSNVTLHKCRTFPHGFSCSSVVMPHSEFLLNFHCGNRGVFLVWSHRAAKCLVSEEHAPYSYVPLSLARTWRVLEVVINVLLLISDSHTKCACVPAIHPHPWAPGSCTALHQGASVSFVVTLPTGVITQEERARGLSLTCDKQKSSFVVAGGELKFVPWKQEAGLGIMFCFAAPFLFFFCPGYLLVQFIACNKWACCQRPLPTTHSSRSVALPWYFIKNTPIWDPDSQVSDVLQTTSPHC